VQNVEVTARPSVNAPAQNRIGLDELPQTVTVFRENPVAVEANRR
jgi:hypothetical protein